VLSGFASFMTQGGSPPFQVYLLPQRLPKLVLVGTTTMFFAAFHAMKKNLMMRAYFGAEP
jgi:uncharacterized protein